MADCKFAHSAYELRHTETLYKTSMCIQFVKGRCQDGSLCRYAHSVDELRKIHDDGYEAKAPEPPSHPSKHIVFEEDKVQPNSSRETADPSIKATFNVYNLRKIVHSSDYENEAEEGQKLSQYDPTQHRYNYLNPFFFYSFNNFPIYYPVTVNQTMPFFNYISINNNKEERHPKPGFHKNSDESSQFNFKCSDESKKPNKQGELVYNSYNNILDAKEKLFEDNR